MQQVKLFIDIESNVESMEARINEWIKSSGTRIVQLTGNIAAQTVTPDSRGSKLSERRFSSSDLFIAIVYEIG